MKMSCQSRNITLRSFFILKPLQDNKVNGLFMDLERVYSTLYRQNGMVPNLAEGGIDKTPKNARIPDNIS